MGQYLTSWADAFRGIKKAITFAFAVISVTAPAWGQANVLEGEEKTFIYVSLAGSDSNPGTQLSPFRTITKAVSVAIANNQKSIGTRITVLPGTYRESINQWLGKQTSLPITLQAQTAGTVTISGAQVWSGWAAYSGNSSIFTHSWPYKWGLCPSTLSNGEAAIMQRREMIFVNGTKLTQVLALGDMHPGTFYVNEGGASVYIWPPAGTVMSTARIEVAVLPTLFALHGAKNWVLRGLTFRYSNACTQSGAPAAQFDGGSQNILIDSVKSSWNNTTGLDFGPASYITVRNSVANHNGQVGMAGRQVTHILWESDEASYNGWRGAQGANYGSNGFSASGSWLSMTRNFTVQGLKTLFNQTGGIHWDTDNADVIFDSVLAVNNFRVGADVEASQGPLTISNSYLCDNNLQGNKYGGGLNLVDASHVTVTGTTLAGQSVSQITVVGQPGGISVTNWETGQVLQIYNQNFTSMNNIVIGNGPQQLFQDTYLSKDWPLFVGTMVSDYNTYWNGSNGKPFTVPVPTGTTLRDFPGWKSLTAKDLHSIFAAPSGTPTAACQVTANVPDYWLAVLSGVNGTVLPGGTASYHLGIIPLSFSGTVQLSLSALNRVPGASITLSTASINTSGSVQLSVKTASSTPAGTYYITVIGQSGSLTRTVAVQLIVQ